MPIYEYLCSSCGAQYSKLQPMSAPKEGDECLCCGKRKTRRVFSSFATAGKAGVSSGGCGPGGGALT